MMPYSGKDIIEATGGVLIRGSAERVFTAVSTDSRETQAGELFIPLKGQRFDGHDFLGAAVSGGATGLLIGEGEDERVGQMGGDVTVIRVKDTLSALGSVARFWRRKFNIPVVAITGSAGKTTTKEMTASIMTLIKNTLKAEGNFNNLVGLPLTLLKLSDEHEAAILEMGTNAPGEIGRLSRIAEPSVGLITNIGPAHLEGLKSLAMIREEKGELFRNLADQDIAVINADDAAIRALAKRWSGKRVTYGLKGDADVTAQEVVSSERGLCFTIVIGTYCGEVTLTSWGTHNVMNALGAAAIAYALGTDGEVIERGLSAFKPMPGRMEIKRLKNGAFLIDDSYNANPLSVREALLAMKTLRGRGKGIVVLGDMLELGDQAEELHEEIGGIIGETGVDTLFLKGVFAQATAAGARRRGMPASRIFFPSTPEDVANHLSSSLQEGDWVLVKGSRAVKMEEVIKMLLGIIGLETGRLEKE